MIYRYLNWQTKIKNIFFKFLILFTFFVFGCASNSTFRLAHSFYKKKNWAVAIHFYDNYIKQNRNRAEATVAEIERSQCYYNLGLRAYKDANYKLAQRFLFLANSQQADSLLDNCYYQFAQNYQKTNDVENTLKTYDFIIKNYPNSELIPEILYQEIKIYLLINKKETAYKKYNMLCKKYPNNIFLNKAETIIDKIIPYFMEKVENLVKENNYDKALEILFYLEKNPTTHKNQIQKKIAQIYLNLAELYIKKEKYVEAKSFFEKAKKWDSSLTDLVNKKLLDIVSLFIKKGDSLLEQEKLDEAIKNYEPIFDIVPEYQPAKDKIKLAQKLKKDFKKADSLYVIAKNLEEQKKYKKALEYYLQSYKLHKRKNVKLDIIHIKNILRANKEPKIFAKEVVEYYKNGIIRKNIEKLEKSLKAIYKNSVKTSDWQIYYSFGKYKYEVRYDITTPEKTYYFIWRVNLEFQTISPLNKISKEYMGVVK